jgi:hypothetical protein
MMRAPTFELNFSSIKCYKISGIFKMGTVVGRVHPQLSSFSTYEYIN